MCVHDAEHDFEYFVFKVIVYVKGHIWHISNFFWSSNFVLVGGRFGLWSVHLVGGRLVVGRWLVGRLVGGFKETRHFMQSRNVLEGKAKLMLEEGKEKRPNKTDSVSDDKANKLWKCEQFGNLSPVALINTLDGYWRRFYFQGTKWFNLFQRDHCKKRKRTLWKIWSGDP